MKDIRKDVEFAKASGRIRDEAYASQDMVRKVDRISRLIHLIDWLESRKTGGHACIALYCGSLTDDTVVIDQAEADEKSYYNLLHNIMVGSWVSELATLRKEVMQYAKGKV